MHQLRTSGLVSLQQEEDAEVRRNSARSDAEAARTRVVSARQQLDRTLVRAPFDGVVTDRKVSAGDTVQVGRELIKVIDPQSLRFEGFIPAGSIGEVKPGQNVVFRVQGQGGGSFPGREQRPRVAGLYAEGRIETARSASLTLPPTAIQRDGDQSFVWKRDGGVLRKTVIQLGERDLRSGQQAVAEGLVEGTEVLRHPDMTLHDGQPVELGADPKPAGG
jgi:multidrug efflux pump subunit AcrA (membrane-fusion protein)